MVEIREVRYIVQGHADRLGSARHNQHLSERRAEAVRDYLVAKGVPVENIQAVGLGTSMPQTSCAQMNRRALIECLAPDRRVTVEIQPPPL
jgi:OOP family OmpA-OmpF porin